jgi:GNAT superfamily N-acetyltransferase
MTSVMMDQVPGTPSPDVTGVAFLRPSAPNLEAVLAMLARCSRRTLFHRFHGFSDGVAYYGALLRNRPADQTLLAWHGSTCVAVASLGVGATGIFHLEVLVEDDWQRRGIGTRLAASLLDNARARGVRRVHADVLGDDLFILRSLRRIGPLALSIECGVFAIDIDLRNQPCRPAEGESPVGFKTATGGDGRLDLCGAREPGRHGGARS